MFMSSSPLLSSLCHAALALIAASMSAPLASAQLPPAPPPIQLKSQVSQFAFTWTFDRNYGVGQYVNGDWWVIGPVVITNITPGSIQVFDPAMEQLRWVNGSMVNPTPKDSNGAGDPRQAYDSGMYWGKAWWANSYVHGRNAGAQLPATLQPGHSLVSSWTHTLPAGNRPQVKQAAVLTVVSSAPSPDAFRPGYTRFKGPEYRRSDMDLSKLGSLALAGEPISLASAENGFRGVWLDHIPDFTSREIHPLDWMENYGFDHTRQISDAALLLQLGALTSAQKTKLATRMVQTGLDFYHVWQDRKPGVDQWPSGGGHHSGRRFLMVLAGHLLDDSALLDAPKVGNELTQTFEVEDSAAGPNFGLGCYSQPPRISLERAVVGDPEWGNKHWQVSSTGATLDLRRPQDDLGIWSPGDPLPGGCSPTANVLQGLNYRTCCNAAAWWGEALALLAMGLREDWDHEPFFDYLDRYRIVQQNRVNNGMNPFTLHAGSPWQIAMWDTHRLSLGPVWQP